MPSIGKTQIGKQGVTDNFILSLKNQFKNRRNIKISVLKSARSSKEDVKKYSEEIVEKLGNKYTIKVIGFTIIVKKWRREVR